MGGVIGDLRLALRMPAKSPATTVAALLSLALGIGVNTTLFQVVDAVLIRPLTGVRAPDELVYFPRSLSYPLYLDCRDRAGSFAALAAFDGTTLSLDSGGEAEPVRAQVVTENHFELLGVQAAVGRPLAASDGAAGSDAAALRFD